MQGRLPEWAILIYPPSSSSLLGLPPPGVFCAVAVITPTQLIRRLKRKSDIRTSMANMLDMEAFKSLALVNNGKEEGEIEEQVVLLVTDFDNYSCAISI